MSRRQKRSRESSTPKHRYDWVAQLHRCDEEGRPTGEVLGSHEFQATTSSSAQRAASTWHRKNFSTGFYGFGGSNDWQLVGSYRQNRYACRPTATTVLLLFPLGSAEASEDVEGMNRVMVEIRANADEVFKRYKAADKLDDLFHVLERYFRYHLDQTQGDPAAEVLEEANLVYDWPGVPAMLARAFGISPPKLRKWLGDHYWVSCPNADKAQCKNFRAWVVDERVKGGYILYDRWCPYCHRLLIRKAEKSPEESEW